MPQRATHLHLAQPCHESWAAMTPTGPGRHCAACQRVVVDFTQHTDAELLAYLARAGAAPCGRFRADQLGRPLLPPAAPSRWRAWLASVLALGGVLGSSRAAAQAGGTYFSAGPTPAVQPSANTPATPAPTPAKAAEPAVPVASGNGGPTIAQGVVLDAISHEPIPGATVLLAGTSRGTTTDSDGRFAIPIAKADMAFTLVVTSVGYAAEQLPAAKTSAALITVSLQPSLTGEVAIVGGYFARKPWPWHPRRLYQWSKYQLLRPFRREW